MPRQQAARAPNTTTKRSIDDSVVNRSSVVTFSENLYSSSPARRHFIYPTSPSYIRTKRNNAIRHPPPSPPQESAETPCFRLLHGTCAYAPNENASHRLEEPGQPKDPLTNRESAAHVRQRRIHHNDACMCFVLPYLGDGVVRLLGCDLHLRQRAAKIRARSIDR